MKRKELLPIKRAREVPKELIIKQELTTLPDLEFRKVLIIIKMLTKLRNIIINTEL